MTISNFSFTFAVSVPKYGKRLFWFRFDALTSLRWVMFEKLFTITIKLPQLGSQRWSSVTCICFPPDVPTTAIRGCSVKALGPKFFEGTTNDIHGNPCFVLWTSTSHFCIAKLFGLLFFLLSSQGVNVCVFRTPASRPSITSPFSGKSFAFLFTATSRSVISPRPRNFGQLRSAPAPKDIQAYSGNHSSANAAHGLPGAINITS